jgi:hypothetical protein
MPYASDAQRRFMHAKHPEIASKWDAEIRAKKKRKVSKRVKKIRTSHGVVIPVGLAIGVGAGLGKSKAEELQQRFTKRLVPIVESDSPWFNHEVAQQVAETVSKMDDDTADMFSYLVMCDILDQDLSANRRTIQRHIDAVAKRCVEKAKHATLQSLSKAATDEALDFATQLDEIERQLDPEYRWEQVTKAYKNPYVTGAYQFEESDFRRDPSTGRFRTKVDVRVTRKDKLNDKQAANLGIKTDSKELQEARRGCSGAVPARVHAGRELPEHGCSDGSARCLYACAEQAQWRDPLGAGQRCTQDW